MGPKVREAGVPGTERLLGDGPVRAARRGQWPPGSTPGAVRGDSRVLGGLPAGSAHCGTAWFLSLSLVPPVRWSLLQMEAAGEEGQAVKRFIKLVWERRAGFTSRRERRGPSSRLYYPSDVSAAVKPAFMSEAGEKPCQVLWWRDRRVRERNGRVRVGNKSYLITGHRCPGGKCQGSQGSHPCPPSGSQSWTP